MIAPYLGAAIRQAQERARLLKGKISQPVRSPEFIALHQVFHDRIDQAISQLEELLSNPLILQPDLARERLRLFRRVLADLALLETSAITALTRPHDDDVALSKLVFRIHQEIRFPLAPPTATCLSREYFSIDSSLRLLEVPPAESDFLLHLPDLYHEIAHLLITTRNNPRISPYQIEYGRFLMVVTQYFERARIAVARCTGPKKYLREALELLEYFWIRGWANEIFCDLFAIYTLGAAYAWAHFHLTAGRDVDPFNIQLPGFMSHPPDQARMEAMLLALDLIGLRGQGAEIQRKWNALTALTGVKASPMYRRACPAELLQRAAVHALEGTSKIGCRIVNDKTSSPIHDLLTTAWEMFWTVPQDYHEWERKAILDLKQINVAVDI